MNQLAIINGRFAKSDAEKLIIDLMRVKILFHENRINPVTESEEDIKHSERRIKELDTSLRELLQTIRNANEPMVDIEADIRIFTINK